MVAGRGAREGLWLEQFKIAWGHRGQALLLKEKSERNVEIREKLAKRSLARCREAAAPRRAKRAAQGKGKEKRREEPRAYNVCLLNKRIERYLTPRSKELTSGADALNSNFIDFDVNLTSSKTKIFSYLRHGRIYNLLPISVSSGIAMLSSISQQWGLMGSCSNLVGL